MIGGRRARIVLALVLVLGAVGAGIAAARLLGPEPGPSSSEAATPTLVWAVGDGPDGDPEPRQVASLIAASRPDRLLYLGDVYEDGTRREYRDYYAPAYGALDRVTSPTPGNHEWPGRERGYDPYWERRGLDTDPHHYSFELAGWQILSLNSEGDLSPQGQQLKWLRRQVAGPGTCRLAYWHRPRYSAGTHHGDDEEIEPLWSTVAGSASLVITAHEHNMQRHEPRDGSTAFVSGAGGRDHHPLDREYDGLAFGNDADYGALRIELRRGSARLSFVTAAGRTLDTSTVRCRR